MHVAVKNSIPNLPQVAYDYLSQAVICDLTSGGQYKNKTQNRPTVTFSRENGPPNIIFILGPHGASPVLTNLVHVSSLFFPVVVILN